MGAIDPTRSKIFSDISSHPLNLRGLQTVICREFPNLKRNYQSFASTRVFYRIFEKETRSDHPFITFNNQPVFNYNELINLIFNDKLSPILLDRIFLLLSDPEINRFMGNDQVGKINLDRVLKPGKQQISSIPKGQNNLQSIQQALRTFANTLTLQSLEDLDIIEVFLIDTEEQALRNKIEADRNKPVQTGWLPYRDD
jgi:hypothetical protein